MVQGYLISPEDLQAAGLDLPSGEQLVEIPFTLLAEAARAVTNAAVTNPVVTNPAVTNPAVTRS